MDEATGEFSHIYDAGVRRLVANVTVAPVASAEGEGLPDPYFADAGRGVTLYQGDAFALLERLPPASFDLIFADPPYFLSGGGITCQSGKMVSVKKGIWDEPTTFEAMHAFNLRWLALCRRLLTPNGTIWVTGTYHNIYSVGYALQTLGYKILNDIAWHKVNPPPNLACRYFTHATETVLWARREATGRHRFDYATMKRENGDRQMQSLWHIKPPAPVEKRHGKHPTQKPEALLDRIIRASTDPGNRILDPFCGSGTTGVVCARHGRHFVGIEQESDYLGIAARRVQDETAHFAALAPAVPLPLPVPRKSLTWADMVSDALRHLGGEGHLSEINQAIEQHPDIRATKTWPCTVRRVVRESPRFAPVGKGRYRLQDQLALKL